MIEANVVDGKGSADRGSIGGRMDMSDWEMGKSVTGALKAIVGH
jgi:hypothetical protein